MRKTSSISYLKQWLEQAHESVFCIPCLSGAECRVSYREGLLSFASVLLGGQKLCGKDCHDIQNVPYFLSDGGDVDVWGVFALNRADFSALCSRGYSFDSIEEAVTHILETPALNAFRSQLFFCPYIVEDMDAGNGYSYMSDRFETGDGFHIVTSRAISFLKTLSKNPVLSGYDVSGVLFRLDGEEREKVKKSGLNPDLLVTIGDDTEMEKTELIKRVHYYINRVWRDGAVSSQFVRDICENGLVNRLSDIYKLPYDKLLECTSESEANSVLNALYVDSIPLDVFIDALSFRVSSGLAKVISKQVGTLGGFLSVTHDDLCGIFPGNYSNLDDFILDVNSFSEDIREIADCIDILPFKAKQKNPDLIFGKRFCFTGKMTKQRNVYEDAVRNRRGVPHKSVSSATDYLVQANPSLDTVKSKKALSLGVEIISEQEFLRMLDNL